MALNIKVSSSDWIDLSTRGYTSGMYLLNAVGAAIEYSTAAAPVPGTTLVGSSAVQIGGAYLWVRGSGDCELYTASEWAVANPKIAPVMASTSSSGRIGNILVGEKSAGIAQHVSGVQSPLIIDGGTDTGLIRAGAFANLSGSTWTITAGSDADGFYVQLEYVSGTGHAIAAFPAALDISSGGCMDWVFDVEFPSGAESTACTLGLFLSNNATLSNSASRASVFNPGGTVGALKPGRNTFFARVESSTAAGIDGSTATGYYDSSWAVNGTYTTASPITHASFQLTGTPESGTKIKLRRVYYNNMNVPGFIFGCDDGHGTTYWLYKLAASLGIKGVIPVVGQFARDLPNYMKPDKLHELHDLGFTAVNHTWAHSNMRTFTYAQALDALGKNHDWLVSQGFPAPKIVVYPNGYYNDNVIRAAKDLGYVIGRSAGKRSLRSTPDYGLENPFRLGSLDTGGQTYDTIRNKIRASLLDAGSELMWLYGHNVTPGNPATNATAPGDGMLWYAGWYKALLIQIGQWIAQGLVRPMSGQDLVDSL